MPYEPAEEAVVCSSVLNALYCTWDEELRRYQPLSQQHLLKHLQDARWQKHINSKFPWPARPGGYTTEILNQALYRLSIKDGLVAHPMVYDGITEEPDVQRYIFAGPHSSENFESMMDSNVLKASTSSMSETCEDHMLHGSRCDT